MLESLHKKRDGFTRISGRYGLSFSHGESSKERVRLTYNGIRRISGDRYPRHRIDGATEEECILKMYAVLSLEGNGTAMDNFMNALYSSYKELDSLNLSTIMIQTIGTLNTISIISRTR